MKDTSPGFVARQIEQGKNLEEIIQSEVFTTVTISQDEYKLFNELLRFSEWAHNELETAIKFSDDRNTSKIENKLDRLHTVIKNLRTSQP